jgi:hypothetical protein
MEEKEMTNEDEKRIADYMGWYWSKDDGIYFYDWDGQRPRYLNLNDAGLVVQEMQKRDDWMSFITFADNEHFDKEISVEFTAWLFNSDNFFKTFVEWRKVK